MRWTLRVWLCRNHRHQQPVSGEMRCMEHPWVTWKTWDAAELARLKRLNRVANGMWGLVILLLAGLIFWRRGI